VVELEVRSAEVLFETSELDARLGQREHLALKRKPLFQLVELALPVLAVELSLVNPAGAALNVHIDEVGFDAGNPRLHALAEGRLAPSLLLTRLHELDPAFQLQRLVYITQPAYC
jgi:hypothetical protein